MKAFSYLRTSSTDNKDKCGLPVQRQGIKALAVRLGFEIEQEFADDITGKVHLHARPQGKLLVAALLADGIKTVLVYHSSRIGRSQPVFWRAIELFRDNGITVLDKDGNDLCGSVMGGVNGMLAEMDRNATVARLAAGKALAKAAGKRTEGQAYYGESPLVCHLGEKAVVERICAWDAEGVSKYRMAKILNAEGIRTRQGKNFKTQTIVKILERKTSK
jgi:site-specific DNA recombinase